MKKILNAIKGAVKTLKQKLHAVLMKIREKVTEFQDRRKGIVTEKTEYEGAMVGIKVLVEQKQKQAYEASEEINWAMHHQKPRKSKPIRRRKGDRK